MKDFVGIMKTAAELKGWLPFYGSKGYQNFEIAQADITDGSMLFIIFPASISAQIESGMWSRYRVTTQVFLGRKFESNTTSSIAETEQQKYDARLKELRDELDDFLNTLFNCHDGFEANNISFFYELNQYSANIDFCGADIIFDIWS